MDVAELLDAAPAPPAPGCYHDSKAFPELDHQRIPDDIPAAAAEEMDRANSPEDHAREQASLRLPAQAGGDGDDDENLSPSSPTEMAVPTPPRDPSPEGTTLQETPAHDEASVDWDAQPVASGPPVTYQQVQQMELP